MDFKDLPFDEKWKIMRRRMKENLAKGIKPKSLYQFLKERGQLQTFNELSPDIQGFLEGKNDDMLIASWKGRA